MTCLSTVLRATIKKHWKAIFVSPYLKQHNRSTGHRNIPLRKALQKKDCNAIHVKDTWKESEIRLILHEINLSIKDQGTFLTSLSMHRVDLGVNGSIHLTEFILKNANCHLHTLHCYQNNLGDNGVSTIVRVIGNSDWKIFHRLKSLSIIQNGVSNYGASQTSKHLRRNNLTFLNLSHNKMTEEGLETLSSLFKENREILTLTISGNLIPTNTQMVFRRGEDEGSDAHFYSSNQREDGTMIDLTPSNPAEVLISKSSVQFSPTYSEVSTTELQKLKSFRERFMEEAALCEKEVVKGRENLREKLMEETLIDLHSKRMEGERTQKVITQAKDRKEVILSKLQEINDQKRPLWMKQDEHLKSELNWLEAEINRREYSQKTSVQDFQKYSLEVMFHRSVVIDQTVDAIKLTKRKEPPKEYLMEMDCFLQSSASDDHKYVHQSFCFETSKQFSGVVSDSGRNVRATSPVTQPASLVILPHIKLGFLYQLRLQILHLGKDSDIILHLCTKPLKHRTWRGLISLITYHIGQCHLLAESAAQVSSQGRFDSYDGMVITCIFDTVKRSFTMRQDDQEVGEVDMNSEEMWTRINFQGGVTFCLELLREGQEVRILDGIQI
uniref:Uncharacterized protein n=1 Tax=Guillardia theta TaxID=55529 RepID=A0A7S4PM67_GUITH|mmetsp:Transcript_620/g.1641  ORF Transcript_620/g.1641 Transcript_620/m.1641 type:complete len:611 (+) Transcript_620:1402-3234(+)